MSVSRFPRPTTGGVLGAMVLVSFVAVMVLIPPQEPGETASHYILEGRDTVWSLLATVVCAVSFVALLFHGLISKDDPS